MKSLIIIEHEPLTVRLKNIWNIDALKERGVHVEYWNLSRLIFPDVDIPMQVDDSCLKHIDKLEEFEKELSNVDVSNTVFVTEFYFNWNNRKIVLLLKKYQCYCVKLDLYANTNLPISFADKVKYRLHAITLKHLINKIRLVYFYKANSIKKYDKVLSSSSYINPDIYINHPDYELYRKIEGPQSYLTNPYILFVDTYYPLHPDIMIISGKTADVKPYRKLMNDFFNFLENKFSKEVVIAAHPKAQYDGNEFGGRKIFWGKTAELIKGADQVFMHGSNSLSFITLADKPFAIVYPDSFKIFPYMYKQVLNLAKYCHKKAYNLDLCDWGEIEFLKWDKELREKYIYGFLTSRVTENRWNVDVWVKELLME